jgi:membrane protease YdiL (CAAX protease family)
MNRYDHFIRLLVLVGFVSAGMVLTALVSAVIMLLNGWSLPELMALDQGSLADMSPALTRLLLACQHMLFFILPGIAFSLLFYRPQTLKSLHLDHFGHWKLLVLGLLFLLASYPLVNLSYLVNEAIPLPSWASSLEDQAQDTLEAILKMDNPLIFLANLLLIAVLPGIGEELIFRGILQKELSGLFRNPIAGIWVAAFIFSAIHLQFEGFLPRLALGAVLGYLFYWTNNLWIPIIVHAFNNGLQVILIYAMDLDISTFDETGSDQLKWWMLPLSVLVMYAIYSTLIKYRNGPQQV